MLPFEFEILAGIMPYYYQYDQIPYVHPSYLVLPFPNPALSYQDEFVPHGVNLIPIPILNFA